MTTPTVPVWAPWTTYYDPAGQGPTISSDVSPDGLVGSLGLDRLVLSLQGDDKDAPLAGATGLSGAVSVQVPTDFNLVGFLLVVRGFMARTAATEVVVSCSIGRSTESLQFPPTGTHGPGQSNASPGQSNTGTDGDRDSVVSADFMLECFTGDYNPTSVGAPPYPPLPPLPVTLSVQGRRRTADDAIDMNLSSFEVILLG